MQCDAVTVQHSATVDARHLSVPSHSRPHLGNPSATVSHSAFHVSLYLTVPLTCHCVLHYRSGATVTHSASHVSPCHCATSPLPLLCSMLLGNAEVPSQGAHVLKIPNGTYEFGANVLDPKVRACCPLLSFQYWHTTVGHCPWPVLGFSFCREFRFIVCCSWVPGGASRFLI